MNTNVLKTFEEKLQDILQHRELHTKKEAPLGHEVFNFMRLYLEKEGFIPTNNTVIFKKLDKKYTRQQIRGRAEKFRRKFRKICEQKGYDSTYFIEKKIELVKKRDTPVFDYDELDKKTKEERKAIRKNPDLPLPYAPTVIVICTMVKIERKKNKNYANI